MNKHLKEGIWLIAICLIVVVAGNISFSIYNTVATPMTNELALGQMINSETADTIGRVAAEGKIWKSAQWGFNVISSIFFILGLIPLVKGIKAKIEEKEKS